MTERTMAEIERKVAALEASVADHQRNVDRLAAELEKEKGMLSGHLAALGRVLAETGRRR